MSSPQGPLGAPVLIPAPPFLPPQPSPDTSAKALRQLSLIAAVLVGTTCPCEGDTTWAQHGLSAGLLEDPHPWETWDGEKMWPDVAPSASVSTGHPRHSSLWGQTARHGQHDMQIEALLGLHSHRCSQIPGRALESVSARTINSAVTVFKLELPLPQTQ